MPWDRKAVLESVEKTSKVIVLHEDTHTGGFGAEIAATIAEEAFEHLDAPVRRITAPDTPVPFAPAAREGVPPAGRRRRRRAPGAGRLLMATGTLVDVVMPQMGVSVSEGTITKWLKAEGETIEADETLLEISTDKVDTEVPSPATGVVAQILVQEGETVEVGHEARRDRARGRGGRPAPAAPAEAPPPRLRPPRSPSPRPRRPPPRAPPPPAPRARRRRPLRLRSRRRAPAAERRRRATARTTAPASSRRSSRASRPSTASTSPAGPGHRRGGRVTKKDILGFIESGEPRQRRLPPAPAPPAPAEAPAARSRRASTPAARTAPAPAPAAEPRRARPSSP